jgi:hypothetical protein
MPKKISSPPSLPASHQKDESFIEWEDSPPHSPNPSSNVLPRASSPFINNPRPAPLPSTPPKDVPFSTQKRGPAPLAPVQSPTLPDLAFLNTPPPPPKPSGVQRRPSLLRRVKSAFLPRRLPDSDLPSRADRSTPSSPQESLKPHLDQSLQRYWENGKRLSPELAKRSNVLSPDRPDEGDGSYFPTHTRHPSGDSDPLSSSSGETVLPASHYKIFG